MSITEDRRAEIEAMTDEQLGDLESVFRAGEYDPVTGAALVIELRRMRALEQEKRYSIRWIRWSGCHCHGSREYHHETFDSLGAAAAYLAENELDPSELNELAASRDLNDVESEELSKALEAEQPKAFRRRYLKEQVKLATKQRTDLLAKFATEDSNLNSLIAEMCEETAPSYFSKRRERLNEILSQVKDLEAKIRDIMSELEKK